MVLPVFIRIHCGMGRFCFSFLANLVLMRKVLRADWKRNSKHMNKLPYQLGVKASSQVLKNKDSGGNEEWDLNQGLLEVCSYSCHFPYPLRRAYARLSETNSKQLVEPAQSQHGPLSVVRS